ncbi:MAG: glycoside hydrolase family 3 C-terminal domain-containing protein [Lachnospiraceae bacterium]|nr:glycoside hydrolase family 3 C-terminal domain-containing protein [Lachnospiraceae bacterium]
MAFEQYEIEHLKRLRPYLPECTVLLKSSGDFPLDGPCAIGAYGSGVRHTRKGGTGSGEVNSHFFIDVETGLVKSGFRITSREWLDAYDDILAEAEEKFVKDVKERARKKHTLAFLEGMGAVMPEPEYIIPMEKRSETAVYVLSRVCGEGSDRSFEKGDILLTDTEVRDILALNDLYDRFMLVLNVGGPVDLTPVMKVKNILLLSQLGVDTGLVLAQILLGKMNPSGKLAATWAAPAKTSGIGTFGETDDTLYKEGIYVGYRYFDTVGEEVLFPFGYGLSYTSFAVKSTGVSMSGEEVRILAEVTNTGSYAGKETLQLYVSVPAGKLDQPYKTLAGFVKTGLLAPGESEQAEIAFRMSDIASYDTLSASLILEAGNYILRVGTSCADTKICGTVNVPETITVKKVRNALGSPEFTDWKPDPACDENVQNAAEPVLMLNPGAIAAETVSYEREYEIDPVVAELTDDELIYMNIGSFDEKGGVLSVVGDAGRRVPGAAGETVMLFEEKGIPGLVMADGPAGVRLTKDYMQDGEQVYHDSSTPESMAVFLPKAVTALSKLMRKKPPKTAVTKHQYCTAIPIGTALAQSWNTAFAGICGDIVGDEMERFGIHLWLAPAMNIQRDMRCGRNFEYYSEDPLLTGKMAAAVTKGVQKHPGRGVTLKHFAANNQETNRFQNNSQVSERTMREIYLKGFEICVREAQPTAVMTSYNLLNGVHTSERGDLIGDILRSEFGFDGIVMTDWIVSVMGNKKAKYDSPHADAIAAAGGDLVMPGYKRDYDEICDALFEGTLSRRQLAINASRVYRTAMKLTSGTEGAEAE